MWRKCSSQTRQPSSSESAQGIAVNWDQFDQFVSRTVETTLHKSKTSLLQSALAKIVAYVLPAAGLANGKISPGLDALRKELDPKNFESRLAKDADDIFFFMLENCVAGNETRDEDVPPEHVSTLGYLRQILWQNGGTPIVTGSAVMPLFTWSQILNGVSHLSNVGLSVCRTQALVDTLPTAC